MPGFEERFAVVKGTGLAYSVAGDGQPVVLLHGLGGAALNWLEVAVALTRGHRVLVPDLPGHGRSSPLAAAPTPAPFADRVAGLLRNEGLEGVIVVGHSFGAPVALRLAARHPELVAGLVLAGAAGITTTTRRAELGLAASALVRPARLVAPFRRRIARSPLGRRLAFWWGSPDPAAISPASIMALLEHTPLHSDTFSATEALIREDPREELEHVRCPVLVLWGIDDELVPLADAIEYARRLRAPLRAIADCGHLLIVERPEACVDAIAGLGATQRGG